MKRYMGSSDGRVMAAFVVLMLLFVFVMCGPVRAAWKATAWQYHPGDLSGADCVQDAIDEYDGRLEAVEGGTNYTVNGGFMVGTGVGAYQEEFIQSGTTSNGLTVTYAAVLTSVGAVQLTYAENPGNSMSNNIALYAVATPSNCVVTGIAGKGIYYTVHGVK